MSAMAQLACCIARGAKVKTPRGEVSIEDVAVGDEVIVVDPQTLEQHVGRVTAVRSAMREAGRLDGLTLTSAHPLFDPEKSEWAPAGDWLLGVRATVQTVNGPRRVARAERFVGVEEVFDLGVDHPLHTFVADGVVVHNKEPRGHGRGAVCATSLGDLTEDGASCVCAHPDQTGTVSCPTNGSAAVCQCDDDYVFFSDWRQARGGSTAAVTDGAKWRRAPCTADAGLAVVPREDGGSTHALRVAPGACGELELFGAGADARAGEMTLLVNGAVTALTPLVVADQLVLIGLAPDVDGGVRFFTGLAASPGVATERVAANTWHRVAWSVDVEGTAARVYPRVGLAPDFGAAEFSAPGDTGSLTEWYADGGHFEVAGAPTRLRLGISVPSEAEVLITDFGLKAR